MAKTYAEILAKLRLFESTKFRSDPEAREALEVLTYDALIALLTNLAAGEGAP